MIYLNKILEFVTDPRSRSESSSTFNHEDIKIKNLKPNVAVVQRINECDERKYRKYK